MTAVGGAALLPASVLWARPGTESNRQANTQRYLFFKTAEASFIEAACARLIPADSTGPGALEADVCRYVDAQLAGHWGAGRHLYRTGTWQPGSALAESGAASPALLFRSSLQIIDSALRRRGTPFPELPFPAQDTFLETLRTAASEVGVARQFFPLLLQLTAEAFFSNPQVSAGRGVIAWPMSSYPGACAICS